MPGFENWDDSSICNSANAAELSALVNRAYSLAQ